MQFFFELSIAFVSTSLTHGYNWYAGTDGIISSYSISMSEPCHHFKLQLHLH